MKVALPNNDHCFCRKQKKFTIIELIVVISIIAIIASMLLPSLNKAREKARNTACINNEKQIGVFFLVYANDYEDYLPGMDSNSYYIHPSVTLQQEWKRGSANTKAIKGIWFCPNTQMPEGTGAGWDYISNYVMTSTDSTSNRGGAIAIVNGVEYYRKIIRLDPASIIMGEKVMTIISSTSKYAGGDKRLHVYRSCPPGWLEVSQKVRMGYENHDMRVNLLAVNGSVQNIKYGVLFDYNWCCK